MNNMFKTHNDGFQTLPLPREQLQSLQRKLCPFYILLTNLKIDILSQIILFHLSAAVQYTVNWTLYTQPNIGQRVHL